MTKEFRLPNPDYTQFAQHVATLRARLEIMLKNLPAELLAERTGASLEAASPGEVSFRLDFWGQAVEVSSPGWAPTVVLTRRELSPPDQALILFYLVTADGTALDSRWVSFSDLPDGRFYVKAFQGYTGRILARTFQNDLPGLTAAALKCGGALQSKSDQLPGDLAFVFPALPRLAVLLSYWLGDDEFEPSAQLLFPAVTPHYLPTDVCAYLGSSLVSRLKRARPSLDEV